MRNKKTNSVFSSLMEEVFKSTLTLALGFVFSTALVGGSAYLLFNSQAERNRIDREIADFGNSSPDIKYVNQMMAIETKGWFADPSNFQRLDDILVTLSNDKNAPDLDANLAKSSLDWLNRALTQLASEKGQIQGFVFNDPLYKGLQANLVASYDSGSSIMSQLTGAIANWKEETPDVRNQRLDGIIHSARNFISESTAEDTQARQALDQVPLRQQQLDQRYKELQDENNAVTLRSELSWIGVGVGGITLMLIAYYGITRRGQEARPTAVNSKMSKHKREKVKPDK